MPHFPRGSRTIALLLLATAVPLLRLELAGQAPTLTLLSREGRRTIPLVLTNDQEYVALDDLASIFHLAIREESGALTVGYKNRTIVLSPDQPLASIGGRLVSLPARPIRAGGKWQVPIDFVNRALAPIYDVRLDLRRAGHLLLVGDVRVPRLSIRHDPLGSTAQVTIDATPRAAATVTAEPGRLLVRFDADALQATLPAIQPQGSQGIVQGITLVDPLTLAIALGPRYASFRTSIDATDGTSHLVIDFTAKPAAATAVAAPPPPGELPALASSAAVLNTIVIDPGHGGSDAGARGAQGTLEKDLTLAVANRLKAAIDSRLGIRVILTRDDDREVALDERSAVANNNKADLFISLHANASVRPDLHGASVLVASFDEAERTRAAADPVRLPLFNGGARDFVLVPWDVAQIAFLPRSMHAAELMTAQLKDRVPLAEPAIDAAPLRVLESANMPAVLVELGYVSNAEQETQLGTPAFQDSVSQAIVDAIVKFREALSVGVTTSARGSRGEAGDPGDR